MAAASRARSSHSQSSSRMRMAAIKTKGAAISRLIKRRAGLLFGVAALMVGPKHSASARPNKAGAPPRSMRRDRAAPLRLLQKQHRRNAEHAEQSEQMEFIHEGQQRRLFDDRAVHHRSEEHTSELQS